MSKQGEHNKKANVELKIPYDFVPLSKWVFPPEWADSVSQDIPMPDSYSGIIEYTLENKTHLCVGSYKPENEKTVSFEQTPDGKHYVIPGTSIKGMLREVLSIASFGKFNQIFDKRHSFRDLSSSGNDYLAEYGKLKISPLWLKFDSKLKQWRIRECRCAKVQNSVLNNFLHPAKKIINSIEVTSGHPNATAKDKYMVLPLSQSYFAELQNSSKDQCIVRSIYKNNNNNKELKNGYIVFTGHRVVSEPKKTEQFDYSYFFYDNAQFSPKILTKEEMEVVSRLLDPKAMEKSEQSELINDLLKNQVPEYGIPLWGLFENKKLRYLGTSRMPRMTSNYSVHEIGKKVSHDSFTDKYDLPEILFGTIRDNKPHFGIKSRVGFSDLYSVGILATEKVSNMLLAEPKSSFTNVYLTDFSNKSVAKNSSKNSKVSDVSYHTALKSGKDVRLSGWKRYCIRDSFKYKAETNENANTKCNVVFVKPKSKFTGKILFNNLNSFEIGALLWVIRFGDNSNCYHSLGYAKPYGAGAVKLNISGIKFPSYENISIDLEKFIKEKISVFENDINNFYKQAFGEDHLWNNSPQLQWLKKIANPEEHELNTGIVYNVLDDFSVLKNNKIYLSDISSRLEPEKLKYPNISKSSGKVSEKTDISDDNVKHSEEWINTKNDLDENIEKLTKDAYKQEATKKLISLYKETVQKWLDKNTDTDPEIFTLIANYAYKNEHHKRKDQAGNDNFFFATSKKEKEREKANPELKANNKKMRDDFVRFVEENRK